MKIINHSRIDIDGIAYYFTGKFVDYDMYEGIDGNIALVDDKGHVTHSSIADIIAWKDAKRCSQEEA